VEVHLLGVGSRLFGVGGRRESVGGFDRGVRYFILATVLLLDNDAVEDPDGLGCVQLVLHERRD
jgi:hypothetical protein